MLTDFLDWMMTEAATAQRVGAMNFIHVSAQPGDFVYFGVHEIESFDPATKIDVATIGPALGKVIDFDRGRNFGNPLVALPQKHRFASKTLEKYRNRDYLSIPESDLTEISKTLLAGGGVGKHKLFLFAPLPRHKKMLEIANRKMAKYSAQMSQGQQPQTQQPAAAAPADSQSWWQPEPAAAASRTPSLSDLLGGEDPPGTQKDVRVPSLDQLAGQPSRGGPLGHKVANRSAPDPLRGMFQNPNQRRRFSQKETEYGYKEILAETRKYYPYY